MSTTPSAAQEELQNIGQFQTVCQLLLSPRYGDFHDKPLTYWVLPTDRRLPLAFLTRRLGELLQTPYEDLAKTPGIGRKKMTALLKLLVRAAETDPAEIASIMPPFSASASPLPARSSLHGSKNGDSAIHLAANDGFDPARVSEVQWSQWRASVVRHGLGGEKLGRFAPNLQNVTKVIWNVPLADFAQYALADMRTMKSYGEKRVRAILEVFHGIHATLSCLDAQPHLAVKLAPREIDRIEQWVGWSLQTPGVPDEEEIMEHFIRPWLIQIENDASAQIVTLAEQRLGIFGPICSVRQSARNMGLTRARVYQLLNEINDIAAVRWPLGRHQVYELRQKLERESADAASQENLVRFFAALELLYPGNRRGADGALDYTEEDFEDETADLLEV